MQNAIQLPQLVHEHRMHNYIHNDIITLCSYNYLKSLLYQIFKNFELLHS